MFPAAPLLVTLLDRVKAIVRRVTRPAGERTRPVYMRADTPVPASSEGAITPALRRLAQGWISARLRAVSALMRRIEAGEEPAFSNTPRCRAAAVATAAPVVRTAGAREECLPRGFGWMCDWSPNVRRDGRAFAEFLNEPWMTAMVLAAPEQMARLVGPILHATGEPRPEWFPAVAKRAGKRFARADQTRADGMSAAVEVPLVSSPRPPRRPPARPKQAVARPPGPARGQRAPAPARRTPCALPADIPTRTRSMGSLSKMRYENPPLQTRDYFVTISKR
jgi:hypothetical protein